VTKIDAKGKQVKTYPYKAMMTPYEKFKSLENPEQHLKPDITLKQLDIRALSINDNEAAKRLKEALNNNSLKPLLDRSIRLRSDTPYYHYQYLSFSIIWLLEYTDALAVTK